MLLEVRALALACGCAVSGLVGVGVAAADGPDPSVELGQQAKVVDGANTQGWTVKGLQPSLDAIPYRPIGTLWEATATAEAITGGGFPFIPGFSARAASGQTYRVLFMVPTAEGVNPSPLSQGQSTTGKLYFDVTGEAPNAVNFGERLTWVQTSPDAAPAAGSALGSGTGYLPPAGYGSAGAGLAGTPGQTGSHARSAQSAPASLPAPAAAPDDVHGAAAPARPTPGVESLDVHDTASPLTAAPPTAAPTTPAQTPDSTAPSAPAVTVPASAADLAAPARSADPIPVVPAPKPMSTES